MDARLHEIAAALRQMSAEEFASKPRGQKLLLINRLKDLVRIDKPELGAGTADVIALMTRLAQFEGEAEYQPVINAGFQWGYWKMYGPNWQGNEDIRSALIDAAKTATESAHKVLAEEFISFLESEDLGSLPRWSTHDLRQLVMALLANANCGKAADRLAELYDKINEATHLPAAQPTFTPLRLQPSAA
jgi:hypothetical protein